MYRIYPFVILFLTTALLQVFLFDNLSVSIYLDPLVYVAFVLLLPLDIRPVTLLGAGLAMGLAMDFAMGTAGLNTVPTLLIAFVRPYLVAGLYSRDDAREGASLRPSASGARCSPNTSWPPSPSTTRCSSRSNRSQPRCCCIRRCASSRAVR